MIFQCNMHLLSDNRVPNSFRKVVKYYISAIQLPCGKKSLTGYFVVPLPLSLKRFRSWAYNEIGHFSLFISLHFLSQSTCWGYSYLRRVAVYVFPIISSLNLKSLVHCSQHLWLPLPSLKCCLIGRFPAFLKKIACPQLSPGWEAPCFLRLSSYSNIALIFDFNWFWCGTCLFLHEKFRALLKWP